MSSDLLYQQVVYLNEVGIHLLQLGDIQGSLESFSQAFGLHRQCAADASSSSVEPVGSPLDAACLEATIQDQVFGPDLCRPGTLTHQGPNQALQLGPHLPDSTVESLLIASKCFACRTTFLTPLSIPRVWRQGHLASDVGVSIILILNLCFSYQRIALQNLQNGEADPTRMEVRERLLEKAVRLYGAAQDLCRKMTSTGCCCLHFEIVLCANLADLHLHLNVLPLAQACYQRMMQAIHELQGSSMEPPCPRFHSKEDVSLLRPRGLTSNQRGIMNRLALEAELFFLDLKTSKYLASAA